MTATCAIVPTFNHHQVLEAILDRLAALALPVIVIDDGSGPVAARTISTICQKRPGVELLRHDINAGKGFAVVRGLRRARDRGFSHALQVDADGQHDLAFAPDLLALSRQDPDALVSGRPRYDDTVPLGRRIGRWVTHFWVFINSLSLDIKDSMCGFRVYPLGKTLLVIDEERIGMAMDFDIEILVRCHWRGIPIRSIPVKVTYPAGNHSNFRLFADNLRISAMHTRLFFGMLRRLPRLATRRQRNPGSDSHWAQLGERGAYWGLATLGFVYRMLGRRLCLVALAPIVLFFYLTGPSQRRASLDYLRRVWRAGSLSRPPGQIMVLRHFMSFASSAIDKLASWTGRLNLSKVDGILDGPLAEAEQTGKGSFVISAHLGNPEVMRAIASLTGRWKVNVLVHTRHAENFNRLMSSFSRKSSVRLIQVTEVGPATAIMLSEAISRGEWVVVMGDRVPVGDSRRVCSAPFLGAMADFPQGPFILGALLKCPVYLLFCLREGDGYKVHFETFADRLELPRGNRERAVNAHIRRYAARLETHVRLAPLQWFNFYPFWRSESPPAPVVAEAQGKAA
ncbi:glycosyltransferase [Emcibacter sp. SYSU 3D8]|uniref:glycosyltransferase family 2 protein n=1 Tax=Emcibacter sp. SYSU 3D8 TaxID=3133969 RepID=UPI0031FF1C2E